MNKSTNTDTQIWTTIITSRTPLWQIPIDELWAYRDLIILQVQRDFHSVYKQTVLGPLWYFIQPLMSTVVFQVIFGKIVGVPTDKIPPFLFFMSGTIIWYYFSACLSGTSSTLTSNAGLFTKVYFPRLAIPVSKVISNFWQFLIQLIIFAGFYLFFLWKGAPIEFSYRIIIIPGLILQTALLGLGCGCLVSALTTRFRDLQMAVAPFLQLWMYGSCILFPLSMVPPEYQQILILNPIVPIVESFRFAVMGQGQIEIWQWLVSLAVTVLIFFVGLIMFNRVEKNMADTI
jgi:lipopolysaccharide transport system permease protein